MSWVIGFDLSLTAPAACVLPLDWRPGNWKDVGSWLFKPPAPRNDDLVGQLKRYDEIARWAAAVIGDCHGKGPRHCFVENYGFSKNNTAASRIMESGGITRMEVWRRYRFVLQPVAQNTARKLFLGKLPAAKKGEKLKRPIKDIIQDVLFNKCKAPKSWDDNQADAWVIANWGLSEVGGRCLTLAR